MTEREGFSRGELTDITISTHAPGKWRFVDMETRDVWRWDGCYVRAAEPFPDGWTAMDEDPDTPID